MNKVKLAIKLTKRIARYNKFIRHCNDWKRKDKKLFRILMNTMTEDEVLEYGTRQKLIK